MTICTSEVSLFPSLNHKKIAVDFSGGHISSDGGLLLLRAMDRRLGLTRRIADLLPDNRDQSKVIHSMLSMLRQRVYGLACGYEDCNDHNDLRHDIALQTSVETVSLLASSPTLCRFENAADRAVMVAAHREIVETFIRSFLTVPKQLILDFDATDDLVHGDQEGKFFHGYYGNHCFLPLYVFCGKQLLVSYLRQSNIDGAKHSWAILSLLVKRFRKEWPDVQIIFRGDGGFCRRNMLDWCDHHKVDYIVGIARNQVLEKKLAAPMRLAQEIYEVSGKKARLFYRFTYQAKSWKHKRNVIGKAEYSSKGDNPRFIVTTLGGMPGGVYDNVYCARGEMENRIKEQQLELFADRTSCSKWWPNQWRLILSSLAYILMERIRATALHGTQLKNATVGTIRLKLLKIGTVITRNTRRISFRMPCHYPYKELFMLVAKRLSMT
jgi:hypothetical protein